jgi:hypothetical protein
MSVICVFVFLNIYVQTGNRLRRYMYRLVTDCEDMYAFLLAYSLTGAREYIIYENTNLRISLKKIFKKC